MRKVSDLLSKPIISLAEGSLEGIVKNISFDRRLKKCSCVEVCSDENEFLLDITDIHCIGEHAVIIKAAQCLAPLTEPQQNNNPINSDVYTTVGECIGKVKDVFIHQTKNEVVKLELLDGTFIDSNRIVSCGKSAVIALTENQTLKLPITPKKKSPKKPKPLPLPEPDDCRQNQNQPHKIIGNYQFLLGRRTEKELRDKYNNLIIKKNGYITQDVVNQARFAGKLVELTLISQAKP